MKTLLNRLATAAHPDRLRIVGLCSHTALTASQVADILGLPVKRVVRDLRLLASAELLSRNGQGPASSYQLNARRNDGGLIQLLSTCFTKTEAIRRTWIAWRRYSTRVTEQWPTAD